MTTPADDLTALDFQPSCGECGHPAVWIVCTPCCNQIRLLCDDCQRDEYEGSFDARFTCLGCGKHGRYLDLFRWWSL